MPVKLLFALSHVLLCFPPHFAALLPVYLLSIHLPTLPPSVRSVSDAWTCPAQAAKLSSRPSPLGLGWLVGWLVRALSILYAKVGPKRAPSLTLARAFPAENGPGPAPPDHRAVLRLRHPPGRAPHPRQPRVLGVLSGAPPLAWSAGHIPRPQGVRWPPQEACPVLQCPG